MSYVRRVSPHMEPGLKTDLISVICSVWYIIRFIKSRPVRPQDSILNSPELRAGVHSGSTPALVKISSSDTWRVFGEKLDRCSVANKIHARKYLPPDSYNSWLEQSIDQFKSFFFLKKKKWKVSDQLLKCEYFQVAFLLCDSKLISLCCGQNQDV